MFNHIPNLVRMLNLLYSRMSTIIHIYTHRLYIILNITQTSQATTTTTFFLSTFKLKPLRTQLLTMSCHFVCVMIDHCPVHGTFTWNGPASIRILSEICASAFRAGRFDTEQQNKNCGAMA